MNYNGIVVINAKNANFNASFDGIPRRLPDGRIFATDKALKYCLREYFSKTEPVFVQREKEFYEQKGNLKQRYLTLKENYLKKCKVNELPKDEKEILDNLLSFIDIRLFGVVFAVDSNISITGPCQISYGVNRCEKSNIYVSSILSPYVNPKAEDAQQTTIGEESRADDVYYVYDICLNMNSAEKQCIKITDSDIMKLKEAMKYAVGEVVSTTMFGVETVSFIWLENKGDKIFNNLNSLVNIYEENNEVVIDYKKVMELVKGEAQVRENYSSKVQNKGLE